MPKAITASRSRPDRLRRLGRAISSRIGTASASRSDTVPAAPIRAISIEASAPPNWTETTPPSTIAVGGTRIVRTRAIRSRRGGSAAMDPEGGRAALINRRSTANSGPRQA
jgi:hypothetical protein